LSQVKRAMMSWRDRKIYVRKSPAEIDLENRLQESAYRAKLEKFMEESYPPEYESLIKDYYKALLNNQQQVNE
jgi:hypothetical protein